MPATIGTIISYTLAAYSAVTAVKALADGDIMGAVMGAVGAFAGFSAGQAFSAGSTTAAVSGGANMSAAALPTDVLSSMGSQAATGGALMSAAPTMATPVTQLASMGSSAAAPSLMSSALTPAVGAVGQGAGAVVDIANAVGEVTVNAGGSLVDAAGNMWDAITKSPIGGSGGLLSSSNIMSGLQAFGGMYAKDKEMDAQKEVYDEARARERFLAEREYDNRNRMPTYVHDFRKAPAGAK